MAQLESNGSRKNTGKTGSDSDNVSRSSDGSSRDSSNIVRSYAEKFKQWLTQRVRPSGKTSGNDATVSAFPRRKQMGDMPDIISERLRAFAKRVGKSESDIAAMVDRPRRELNDLFSKHRISRQEADRLLEDLKKLQESLGKRAKDAAAESVSKAKELVHKAHRNSGISCKCFSRWWEWIRRLPSRWWQRVLQLLQVTGQGLKRILILLLWVLLILALCVLAFYLIPHLVSVIPPNLVPWLILAAVIALLVLAAALLGLGTIKRWLSKLVSFVTSIITGKLLLKILLYVLALALFVLSSSVLFYRYDAKMLNQLKAMMQVDPLPVARALVSDGKYCDALEHLEFFLEYDYVRGNPDIVAYYEQVKKERDSWWFSIKDAFSGIWRGKGACYESLIASTVSDFFVVGDLRDLSLEAQKWLNDEETDEFVVALAAAGVILTAPTYAGGAGAPAKGSLSLLKVAKRLERIPKTLQKELVKVFREVARLKSIEPIKPLVHHISSLRDISHLKTRDFMEMLSRCSSIADLKLMRQAALAYGNKTGKVLRLGGDEPVRLLTKYGKDANLCKAVDESLQYGSKGTHVLAKVGPTKFLRYLKLAKYGVRAGRSLWQQRLLLLAAWLLRLLPEWAIWVIAVCTGIVVVVWPALGLARFFRSRTAAA